MASQEAAAHLHTLRASDPQVDKISEELTRVAKAVKPERTAEGSGAASGAGAGTQHHSGKRSAAEMLAGSTAPVPLEPPADGTTCTGDVAVLLSLLAQLQQGQTLAVAPLPLGPSSTSTVAAAGSWSPHPAGKRPRRAAARGALAVMQAEQQLVQGVHREGVPDQLLGRLFSISLTGQPSTVPDADAAVVQPALQQDMAPIALQAAAAAAPAAGDRQLPDSQAVQLQSAPLQHQAGTSQPPPALGVQQPQLPHSMQPIAQQQQQQLPMAVQRERQQQPEQVEVEVATSLAGGEDISQAVAAAQKQEGQARGELVMHRAAGAAAAAAMPEHVLQTNTPADVGEQLPAVAGAQQQACSPASGGDGSSDTVEATHSGNGSGSATQAQQVGASAAGGMQAQGEVGMGTAAAAAVPPALALPVASGRGEEGPDEDAPGSPTASEAALLNELMQQRGSSTIPGVVDFQPEIAMAFARVENEAETAAAAAAAAAGSAAGAVAGAAVPGMAAASDAMLGAGTAAATAGPLAAFESNPALHTAAVPLPRKARGSSGGGRVGKRKGGMPATCPGCGAMPLSEEDKRAASKRGRRRKNDESDPRNRKAELSKDFLVRHLITARLSLRDICFYHGHCATTVSRVARNLGMELPSGRVDRKAESSQHLGEASGTTEAAALTAGGGEDDDAQGGNSGGEEAAVAAAEVRFADLGQGHGQGHAHLAEELPEVVVVDATAEQAKAAAQEALQALEAAAPQHTGVVALPAVPVEQRQRAAELAAAAVAGAAQRAAEGAPMLAAAIDLATVAACLNTTVAVLGEPQAATTGAGAAAAAAAAALPMASAALLVPALPAGSPAVEVQAAHPGAAAAAAAAASVAAALAAVVPPAAVRAVS